jgi:hypothetical protein
MRKRIILVAVAGLFILAAPTPAPAFWGKVLEWTHLFLEAGKYGSAVVEKAEKAAVEKLAEEPKAAREAEKGRVREATKEVVEEHYGIKKALAEGVAKWKRLPALVRYLIAIPAIMLGSILFLGGIILLLETRYKTDAERLAAIREQIRRSYQVHHHRRVARGMAEALGCQSGANSRFVPVKGPGFPRLFAACYLHDSWVTGREGRGNGLWKGYSAAVALTGKDSRGGSRSTVKAEPLPGWEAIANSPRWRLRMCLTMASPSPVPPFSRLDATSMR